MPIGEPQPKSWFMFDFFAEDLYWAVFLDKLSMRRVGLRLSELDGRAYYACIDLVVLAELLEGH